MPFADNKRRKRESLFFNKKLQRVTSVSAATEAIRENLARDGRQEAGNNLPVFFRFLDVRRYFLGVILGVNILE